MRPSLSFTLEADMEQAVPCGRDLYTFVTSAAGHMMRTLQKPRKNRPSKRQVNHRRFLHNMIQRKFADIEAANHRLASSLYYKDEPNILTSLQSQKPEDSADSSQNQLSEDTEKHNVLKETEDTFKSADQPEDAHQTEDGERNGTLSLQSETRTSVKVNTTKGRKKTGEGGTGGTDLHPGSGLLSTQHDDSENLLTTDVEASLEKSPSSSLELSPLSVDSCDFSVHMFTDISTCVQTQQSISDLAESPWADFIDLFDSSGCMDDGEYQSAPAGGREDEQEAEPQNQSECFPQATNINVCQTQELCHSTYHLHRYHDDPVSTITTAAGSGFNDSRTSGGLQVDGFQIFTSSSCHYDNTSLRSKPFSDCMQDNVTPFEGVAQSFAASLHYPQHRTIATPPHEHDWMFPDILKDGESLHSEESECHYPAL